MKKWYLVNLVEFYLFIDFLLIEVGNGWKEIIGIIFYKELVYFDWFYRGEKYWLEIEGDF